MNFAQRRSALHDNAPALFVRGYPVRSRRTIARPRSRSSARPIAGPSSMPVCGRVPPPVPVPPVPVPPLVAVAVPWKMLVPKILGVGVWSICAIASVAVGCGVFVAVDVAVFVGCGGGRRCRRAGARSPSPLPSLLPGRSRQASWRSQWRWPCWLRPALRPVVRAGSACRRYKATPTRGLPGERQREWQRAMPGLTLDPSERAAGFAT